MVMSSCLMRLVRLTYKKHTHNNNSKISSFNRARMLTRNCQLVHLFFVPSQSDSKITNSAGNTGNDNCATDCRSFWCSSYSKNLPWLNRGILVLK